MPILVEIFEKNKSILFKIIEKSQFQEKEVETLISQSLCMENLYSIEICKILENIDYTQTFQKCQKLLILVKKFRKINLLVTIAQNLDLSNL